jgi:hypothetical protein
MEIWRTDRFPKNNSRYLYRAIAGFYTLQSPDQFVRRIMDACFMKLGTVDQDNSGQLDPDANYLIVDKNREVKYQIFRVYKTFKTYGEQRYDVRGQLARIFDQYIKHLDLKPGAIIFPNEKGKFYSPSAFSTIVGNVFQSITPGNKRMYVNLLRHSRISEYLSKTHTLEEKTIFATSMSHKLMTQQIYDRQNIQGDLKDDRVQAIDLRELEEVDSKVDDDDVDPPTKAGSSRPVVARKSPATPVTPATPVAAKGWRAGRTPAQIEEERVKNRARMAASRKPATVVGGSRRSTRHK